MTSPLTSGPTSWRGDPATTSLAARYAAAGLLTVAAILFLGGSHDALASALHDARTQTAALDLDLARVDGEIDALSATLANEVTDAVESARAATLSAEEALAGAAEDVTDATDEARTALALSDAQVALEAAAAQVRHVRGQVGSGAVGESLTELLAHLDALRLGEG
ncbi:hypothetical protein [Luteimicrobium sp. DT211]|uniref:hypothetical protein n=1 Tax=Luteimicrobium sp. DT211 TaxID=3393412 RepID=UPI003CEE4B3F